MILTGGGSGSRVSINELAQWLLAQALMRGPEGPVQDLDRYVRGGTTPYCEVLALAGIEINEEVLLADDISVVPFSALPNSPWKESLSATLRSFELEVFSQPSVEPTVALIRRRAVEPGMVVEFPDPTVRDSLDLAEIIALANCITLVGPCSPIPLACWTHAESWVPLTGQSWGGTFNIPEISPFYSSQRFSKPDPGLLLQTIGDYCRLTPEIKSALRVPIERLNAALRRAQPVDQAIELGIALEALLVSHRENGAPISYLLGLRGSLFLGGSGAARKRTFECLRKLYTLRSKGVHGGSLKSFTFKFEGKSIPVNDFLWEGAQLCALLIRKIMAQGSFPNWTDLELGLSPE